MPAARIAKSNESQHVDASSPQCGPIDDALRQWAADFDRKLDNLLTAPDDAPPELIEAMRYSALAGGKRLRPYLVTRCCELTGGNADLALPAAAAVECVHTFSLIHDDLPAMDDDDLRRGRPTSHKQFGEALAILAGDALVTLAFELIVRHTQSPARAAAMVLELARGTGRSGMIGGQVADILGENHPPSRKRTEYIHAKKTAALFETACRLGALAAGASDADLQHVAGYGSDLGRAFQIADDLLDVTATTEEMGKTVGKDAHAGKQSFPTAFGVEESRRTARSLAEQAIASIRSLGRPTDDLTDLAMFVVQRQH